MLDGMALTYIDEFSRPVFHRNGGENVIAYRADPVAGFVLFIGADVASGCGEFGVNLQIVESLN